MILESIRQGTKALSIDNFNLFNDDYIKLHQYKETSSFRKFVCEIKRFPELKPFVKRHFESLINKYDYKQYKDFVLNDERTERCLNLFTYNKSQEEKENIIGQIVAYLITETYVGFTVEYVLAEALKSRGQKVYQNNLLDIKYKTDLLVCGKHYQIKNYSFLETSWIENKLKEYGEANRRLYFLFYITMPASINFVAIKFRYSYKWDEIDDFTQLLDYELLSLDEIVESIIRA